jgi:hypothetical protein
MGAILDTTGLAERLLDALRPDLGKTKPQRRAPNGGRRQQ